MSMHDAISMFSFAKEFSVVMDLAGGAVTAQPNRLVLDDVSVENSLVAKIALESFGEDVLAHLFVCFREHRPVSGASASTLNIPMRRPVTVTEAVYTAGYLTVRGTFLEVNYE